MQQTMRDLLATLPPEQRLEGLSPEDRLRGLTPEELERLWQLLKAPTKADNPSPPA
jgi:hypothetical protein